MSQVVPCVACGRRIRRVHPYVAAVNVALRGARPIADAYLADRPAARRRWEAYVEARQEAARSEWTPWRASWVLNARRNSAREERSR